MKPVYIAIIAVGAVLAGIAVLKPTHSKTSPSSPMATPNAVTIQGYAFTPSPLKVKKGTKITWTNNDIAKHTITIDDAAMGGPSSPLFGKGETYSYTFETVGVYKYHCDPHPYMHGSIEVTE